MSDSHVSLRSHLEGVLGLSLSGEGGACGDVDHTLHLSENVGALCMKQDFSDVVMVVEGEKFPAHRVILASRSEYFRALLYGGMKESEEAEITLEETNVFAFKILLKYVYTGRISLGNLREDVVMDVLGLAHKYGFIKLQNSVADYMKAIMNTRNLCQIFNISQLYLLNDLTEYCLVYADRNAPEILCTSGFLQLPVTAVEQLISRDSFCAPEIDIFNAIKEWVRVQPETRTSSCSALMSCVRLSLIGQKDLLQSVRPSGLLAPDALLDAIEELSHKKTTDLTYRGFLTPDTNIATSQLGALVKFGETPNPNTFLSADANINVISSQSQANQLESDRSSLRHSIGESQGIVIELGNPYIINTLKLVLPDKEPRMYSYYIDMSIDCRDWVRVVDYSQFLCRSRQTLHFSARSTKYIRIVGTHNTQSNRMFHLAAFEALYSSESCSYDPQLGIVIPSSNVATIENNASVIEGVSRCRNALLNGETENYDWDTGYTCHQLGSGAITVQLPQPYIIDSMRLLLWDCDDRFYSYYVEVSVNQQTWKRVADRTEKQCRSWQAINFPAEPVVFIRIVGTNNSANEVFHCVHFECPAVKDAPPVDERSVIPPLGDGE